jgi:hypothetical protein
MRPAGSIRLTLRDRRSSERPVIPLRGFPRVLYALQKGTSGRLSDDSAPSFPPVNEAAFP